MDSQAAVLFSPTILFEEWPPRDRCSISKNNIDSSSADVSVWLVLVNQQDGWHCVDEAEVIVYKLKSRTQKYALRAAVHCHWTLKTPLAGTLMHSNHTSSTSMFFQI